MTRRKEINKRTQIPIDVKTRAKLKKAKGTDSYDFFINELLRWLK